MLGQTHPYQHRCKGEARGWGGGEGGRAAANEGQDSLTVEVEEVEEIEEVELVAVGVVEVEIEEVEKAATSAVAGWILVLCYYHYSYCECYD